MLKKVAFAAMLGFSHIATANSHTAATPLQQKMISFIDSMAGVYESMYAPSLWKKEFAGWTLEAQANLAKKRVLEQDMGVSDFHKIVNDFILSMKDYHVSVRFHATERATLPFTVRGTEDRLFFVYIDRAKLPKKSFPFEIGDELIAMDSTPAADIVSELKSKLGGNVDETDLALAQMGLTSRSASKSDTVPKGPVTLTIKKKGSDKLSEHQLIWQYQEELITRAPKRLPMLESRASLIPELNMSSPVAMEFADTAKDANASNPFSLGGKKSFLPELGQRIWSSDKNSSFDAYIYLNDDRELIGYVRIPTYGAGAKESAQFKEIIQRFEKLTDKLVIDQLNNPGGSVFYLYSLVSMLSDKAMATPKHYIAINQQMALSAYNSLKQLEEIKDLDGLKKAMGGDTVGGYPLSMSMLEFMKSHYKFVLDEWQAGKKLTTPYHLYGVDKINPHPEVQYTKPILLLVNELDFSGGDFFPAIMQDNKRATIMGVRTAGAGGYVIGVDIPNQLGVAGFYYTGSLADRVDHTPIENLGVTPDIEYRPGADDYQNQFKNFKERVNQALKELQ